MLVAEDDGGNEGLYSPPQSPMSDEGGDYGAKYDEENEEIFRQRADEESSRNYDNEEARRDQQVRREIFFHLFKFLYFLEKKKKLTFPYFFCPFFLLTATRFNSFITRGRK